MSRTLDRAADRTMAWEADTSARAAFIGRTYSHLFGAVVAFVLFELLLFRFTSVPEAMLGFLAGGGGMRWLLFLGAFMIVGWLASVTAFAARSATAQYLALFGYVTVEALIFVPLLLIAKTVAPGAIQTAGLVTLLAFAGLTAVAFTTRKDFSFLGGILRYGLVIALVLIVGGAIFGFQLGLWFSIAMVAFAGAAVLWDTSNVLHHYPTDKHVAASLSLFASIALMFWYVLRIAIAMRE